MVRYISNLFPKIFRSEIPETGKSSDREFCLVCDVNLEESAFYIRNKICPACRFHYSMTARERIDFLADQDSFKEINRSLVSLDPLSFSSRTSYRDRLFSDQKRTGLTEAVVTGTCTIDGISCVLAILDFGFLGGTMGCVVGEKISLAFERAAKMKIPVISVVTSGGSRIQEGVLSLMQMAKTSVASNHLNEKGVPYISILANPATGQAYASFANLADIILAEPGAIVGYNPISNITSGEDSLAENTHTSESHLEHGLVDAVVERTELKGIVSVLLDLFQKEFRIYGSSGNQEASRTYESSGAWHSVQLARHTSRPTSMDLMARMMDNFVELHGDRMYGDDPSIVCGLGQIGGQTVTVIGQERGHPGNLDIDRREGRAMPEGFRKAQRALSIAQKFELPVISFIDTPGANLSAEAENRGLGNSIASTMAMISGISVPTLSAVIGEGGSAGALALGATDRVIMLENAIYSAVSPEEAAEIIYQDESKVEEVAESLKLTAFDCKELGIVDQVIPEPHGGAHTDHHETARLLKRGILQELVMLQGISRKRRLKNRYKKFRNIGEYSSHFGSSISREVNTLRGTVSRRVKEIRSSTSTEAADAEFQIHSSE